MWSTRTSCRAAASALTAVLVVLAVSVTPGPAFADDRLRELDRVAPDQTLTAPSLVTTWGGVTVAAWSRSGTKHRIRVMRAVASGSWSAIGIPMGVLTYVSGVKLLDDPTAKRTFLVADARGEDLAATLGTYVWVSKNQGASWSGPTRVWDSFGSSYAALDGDGGLYLLINQTGAQVAQVPADLTMQRFYDDEWLDLGGRLGSRGYLDLAAAGTSRTLLLSFQDSTGNAWVHRGVVAGTAVEERTYTHQFGPVPVAGDTKRAAVGAIRAWAGNGNAYRVYVRRLNPATGALGPIRRISAKHEEAATVSYQLQHLVRPHGGATGRIVAAWVRYDGALRYAKSLTTDPSGRWSAAITVQKATHGRYGHFSFPSANQSWTIALGYRVTRSHNLPVVIATRTGVDH